MRTTGSIAIGNRNTETGIALMTLAMLIVPGMDAIAKLLAATLAPGQITWARFLFQTLALLPLMLLLRRPTRSGQPGIHAARGVLLATAILLLIWGLRYLPLANAIAIFFVEPLVLTLFSAAFLRERVGIRRLAAVVAGLVGALIVIRPNWSAYGWAAVLPLGTAVCFAGYLTLTRHSAVAEDPLAMQLWAGIFAALALSAAIALGYGFDIDVLAPVWPDAGQWGLLLVLGLISALGHVMIAFAFRYAAAGVLAPFQYLEIISATLLGLLLFGDLPDAITWLGTAVIIGAGLYVLALERRGSTRPPQPTDGSPGHRST